MGVIDGWVLDVDGVRVNEYDDVELLVDVKYPEPGNVSPRRLPSGSVCTVITAVGDPAETVELECYVGKRGFVFANLPGSSVRLRERSKDKLERLREGSQK